MGGFDCQSIPGTLIPNPLRGLQSQLAIILCGIHPIIKSSNQILTTSDLNQAMDCRGPRKPNTYQQSMDPGDYKM